MSEFKLIRGSHSEMNPPIPIHINSKDRITGTHCRFEWPIQLPPNQDYNRVVLSSASIPKSYYLIPDNRNTFGLTEGVASVVITLPIGNYNVNNFRPIIEDALNNASPNGWVYEVNYMSTLNKWEFIVSGNGGTQPALVFGKHLYLLFGFDADTINPFVAGELNSQNVVNFLLKQRLMIRCPIVFTSDSANPDLLETISGVAGDSTYIQYQCKDIDGYARKLQPFSGNSITIIITDEDGVEIDTNGQSVLLTILFLRNQSAAEVDKYERV